MFLKLRVFRQYKNKADDNTDEWKLKHNAGLNEFIKHEISKEENLYKYIKQNEVAI